MATLLKVFYIKYLISWVAIHLGTLAKDGAVKRIIKMKTITLGWLCNH
jgi:hypothetical protein